MSAAIHLGWNNSHLQPGVSINGGTPKWLVYNGKSSYKWMMTRGTPISGNLQPYNFEGSGSGIIWISQFKMAKSSIIQPINLTNSRSLIDRPHFEDNPILIKTNEWLSHVKSTVWFSPQLLMKLVKSLINHIFIQPLPPNINYKTTRMRNLGLVYDIFMTWGPKHRVYCILYSLSLFLSFFLSFLILFQHA